MHEYVVVEHPAVCTSMLSSIYSSSTASKAQHRATSPAQSSKPSTCRSERDSPSKHTELARASTSSGILHSVIVEPSFSIFGFNGPNTFARFYNCLHRNMSGSIYIHHIECTARKGFMQNYYQDIHASNPNRL